MPLMPMTGLDTAAQTIIAAVGALDDVEVFGNNILIGIYQRPDRTASGIILTDGTRAEDKYQGKVGLVLKKGPTAFAENPTVDFGGLNVEVGDWVAVRVSEAWPLVLGSADGHCRLVADQDVRLRVSSPDRVF